MTTTTSLARAAALGFEDYHPGAVIDAVNVLQPLGGEALSAVDEFLSRQGPTTPTLGLFWVLRALMEVPPTVGFPVVAIGEPTVKPPDHPDRLPRFPIVIVRDVPLLAVRGYNLGGLAEPVEAHLRYFRAHGSVRPVPLTPPASVDGVDEEFDRAWDLAYEGAGPAEGPLVIREQLQRLISMPLGPA